ncbi:MAG: SpoIID/LytB domain-containing protein [Acidobacteriaceae bacterium]|nr:SpoIID/LytB domain-containing protein [Acidobacteriaceae bacterium]
MRQFARVVVFLLLISPAVCAQTTVSVGVFSLFKPKEILLETAGTQALSVSIHGKNLILNGEPGHRRLLIRAEGDGIAANRLAAERCTVEARDGSPVRFRISVPGRIRRVYEGKLTVIAHGGVLTPVVAMDRETAVASIVASEMPRAAPLEALKAQAVVSRSFLSAGARHHDFDFCDTTHCQFLRSPDDISDQVRQAVTSTRNMVLSWQGHTIAALYSSRCGGHTRSLADVGMSAHGGYPYYAVECPWCHRHPVRWQTRLKADTPAPRRTDESSRIAFARQWGWGALPGSDFTVKQESGNQIVEGHSIGHSLGLCQFGAAGLASSGADFRSILAHYFPDTQLVQLPQ